MTTIVVCGGRSYGRVPNDVASDLRWQYEDQAEAEQRRLVQILDAAVTKLDLRYLAVGDATGADALAASWAERRGMPFKVYVADWQQHGNAAGPVRNKAMLEEAQPSCVIAFPGSKGTRNMVGLADKAGIRVIKVDW
ncbi:DUF2493 domain-containing protein [Boseaceae bacterium BT-24-1]|nr:DUF2493 domain-containing protein [Boseaceae bacterium BT-24-1]